MFTQVMLILGFIIAVVPPILQAAQSMQLPPLAQKILAVIGAIVFLAVALQKALTDWQAAEHAQELKMAALVPSEPKK